MKNPDSDTWIPNPSGDSLPDKKPFTAHPIDGHPKQESGSIFGDPEFDAVWDAAEAGQFELAENYFSKYGLLSAETDEFYVEIRVENLDNGRVLNRYGKDADGKPVWSLVPLKEEAHGTGTVEGGSPQTP